MHPITAAMEAQLRIAELEREAGIRHVGGPVVTRARVGRVTPVRRALGARLVSVGLRLQSAAPPVGAPHAR